MWTLLNWYSFKVVIMYLTVVIVGYCIDIAALVTVLGDQKRACRVGERSILGSGACARSLYGPRCVVFTGDEREQFLCGTDVMQPQWGTG